MKSAWTDVCLLHTNEQLFPSPLDRNAKIHRQQVHWYHNNHHTTRQLSDSPYSTPWFSSLCISQRLLLISSSVWRHASSCWHNVCLSWVQTCVGRTYEYLVPSYILDPAHLDDLVHVSWHKTLLFTHSLPSCGIWIDCSWLIFDFKLNSSLPIFQSLQVEFIPAIGSLSPSQSIDLLFLALDLIASFSLGGPLLWMACKGCWEV